MPAHARRELASGEGRRSGLTQVSTRPGQDHGPLTLRSDPLLSRVLPGLPAMRADRGPQVAGLAGREWQFASLCLAKQLAVPERLGARRSNPASGERGNERGQGRGERDDCDSAGTAQSLRHLVQLANEEPYKRALGRRPTRPQRLLERVSAAELFSAPLCAQHLANRRLGEVWQAVEVRRQAERLPLRVLFGALRGGDPC
jgi:hypothetical protein